MLNCLLKHKSIVIVLAVLLPRIAWFIYLGGYFPEPPRDQGIYLRLAGRIASGDGLSFSEDLGWLKNLRAGETSLETAWSSDPDYVFGMVPVETPTASLEPGYPVILALMYSIAGPTTGAAFLLNCIFALIGAWALWKMVAENWGKKQAFFAALIWSLYPYYVYYSAYAMTDSIHISMLPLIMWLTLHSVKTMKSGFPAGIASGFLFLIRSTAVVLLPLQMIYLLFKKKWKTSLFLLAGFAVCCVPWVVRNQIELGSPVFLPTKGSLNLWMRNNPEIIAMEGIVLPGWIEDGINRRDLLVYPPMDGLSGELERSRVLSERANQFIFANPVLFLYLSVIRLGLFISPVGGTLSNPIFILVGFLLYLPLLVFGVTEIIRRRKDSRILFLGSFFLVYLLMHSLAHGGVRYRLPVETVLIIASVLFMSRKCKWVEENNACIQ
ncbi:MAG: glycosyltransferase family 39 protein [Candidatus Aegiribacteria sp.]|nr:glycosyltransferase family 39 protein [Candidatus Aegiribacteria sp.]